MTENAENILNKWLNGRNIQTNTFPSHNVHNNAPMKELMQKQTQKNYSGVQKSKTTSENAYRWHFFAILPVLLIE